MASSKAYLAYVLDQLSGLPEVTWRAMMGEYLLYYRGRLFGGVYDDRLLVKDVPAARALLPSAAQERPYEGAGPMLLPDVVDDRARLQALILAMYPELLEPKKRKHK